jgi:ABC-type lipoprotein release transport system permease subunit
LGKWRSFCQRTGRTSLADDEFFGRFITNWGLPHPLEASREFGFCSCAALILAVVGIYGATAYAVNQRTHEIGIRTALGAQRRDVLRLVMKDGTKIALFGIASGMAGALALTRLMASLLFEAKPTDPAIFADVASLLALVALAACYIPGAAQCG